MGWAANNLSAVQSMELVAFGSVCLANLIDIRCRWRHRLDTPERWRKAEESLRESKVFFCLEAVVAVWEPMTMSSLQESRQVLFVCKLWWLCGS